MSQKTPSDQGKNPAQTPAVPVHGRASASAAGFPEKQGLYDPANEKDSCGVGFICDIKGRPSRQIIEDALNMNCCMEHRGGVGYEKNTGDGAGILLGLPQKFLAKVAETDLGQALPEVGQFGVGNVFLPLDPAERSRCHRASEGVVVWMST